MTEKDVVSMTMMNQEGDVTFLWTRGDEGEDILDLLDRWDVTIGCDAASREDMPFIMKHPEKHQ